jgi:hypothetical protein
VFYRLVAADLHGDAGLNVMVLKELFHCCARSGPLFPNDKAFSGQQLRGHTRQPGEAMSRGSDDSIGMARKGLSPRLEFLRRSPHYREFDLIALQHLYQRLAIANSKLNVYAWVLSQKMRQKTR